ncbi:MAG: hypothetical protein GY835_05510 [bacterium]|nr:hypothetical protein [bacterium]
MSDQELDTRDLVKLTTLDNAIQAQVLGGLLTERGIRFVLDRWESMPYSDIFANQKGYARMMVFKADLAAAKTSLTDLKSLADAEDVRPASEDTQ